MTHTNVERIIINERLLYRAIKSDLYYAAKVHCDTLIVLRASLEFEIDECFEA